jgi:hypothetical protein
MDKDIAEATIRAQLAAIAEEKEVVGRHRLSAELLAQLTEKVGRARLGRLGRGHAGVQAIVSAPSLRRDSA